MLNTKQKKQWLSHCKGYGLGINAVWGTFKGDEFTAQQSTACFASIASKEYVGCELLLSKIMVFEDPINKDSRYEDIKFFYTWLLEESPWSEVFLDKSVDSVLGSRTLIVDTNKASNLVIGALSCARTIGEHGGVLNCFVDLCKAGTNKNLAYVLALGNIGGRDRSTNDLRWTSSGNAHKPFSSSDLDGHSLSNWINGKKVLLNEPLKVNPNYQSDNYICVIWGRKEGESLNSFISKMKMGDWVDAGNTVKASDLNPFRKDKVLEKEGYYCYSDSIKAMANFSKSIEENFCA